MIAFTAKLKAYAACFLPLLASNSIAWSNQENKYLISKQKGCKILIEDYRELKAGSKLTILPEANMEDFNASSNVASDDQTSNSKEHPVIQIFIKRINVKLGAIGFIEPQKDCPNVAGKQSFALLAPSIKEVAESLAVIPVERTDPQFFTGLNLGYGHLVSSDTDSSPASKGMTGKLDVKYTSSDYNRASWAAGLAGRVSYLRANRYLGSTSLSNRTLLFEGALELEGLFKRCGENRDLGCYFGPRIGYMRGYAYIDSSTKYTSGDEVTLSVKAKMDGFVYGLYSGLRHKLGKSSHVTLEGQYNWGRLAFTEGTSDSNKAGIRFYNISMGLMIVL